MGTLITMSGITDNDAEATPQAGSDGIVTGAAHTSAAVRASVLELLRNGLLEAADKPALYRNVLLHRNAVADTLGSLDLALRLDEIRGLAFVVVAATQEQDADEWSHPLVRKQRLTLEQSLLVAILRQKFVAHEMQAGVGAAGAIVAQDELLPQLQVYLGDLGSDAQERKRLLALLEQLKSHGLVSDVDQHDRVTIRPIIAHVANPENLVNLVRALRRAAGGETPDTQEPDE